MKYVVLICVLFLTACSSVSSKDSAIATKANSIVTTVTADVDTASAAVVAKVIEVCPFVAAHVTAIENITQSVATFLGFPATGTVVVSLETSAANYCQVKAQSISTGTQQ